MSWRDELLPAQFRGVAFHVSSADGKGGRRLALHEYPGRDEPFAEDLGRRGAGFSVEAFVVGDDVLDQARQLAAALDEPGPGTLVHPWLGERTVAVADYSERYSSRGGGVAEFSITFQATVQPTYPAAAADQTAAVDAAALSADEASLRQLAEEFAVASLPDYLAVDAGELLAGGLDELGGIGSISDISGIGGLLGDMRETLGPWVAKGETLARWSRGMMATARDALSLVQSPMALGGRLLGLMDLGGVGGIGSLVQHVVGLAGDGSALLRTAQAATIPSWRAWLPLADWAPALSSVPLTTPSRRQQAANRAAVVDFVRRSALVQSARAAAREAYPTYEDAVAARTALATRIDTAQETASADGYRALSAVRAAVVRSVSAAAPELPRLLTVTPAQTTPAIVLAYQTFGDDPSDSANRAEQLVARNRVRHPMFVPGGEAVQMIARTQTATGTGAR